MDKSGKPKQVINIGVFGNASVGKTSLIKRFCDDKFDERHRASTCGLDFEEKILEMNGGKVNLRIWDSAGQERYAKALSHLYFQKKQGVILVYSIDDRKSFEKVQDWMDQVNEKAPEDAIKILVASKCDSDDIQVSKKEGSKLAEKYQIQFVETSSKNGEGVTLPFYMIAEGFLQQVHRRSTALTETDILNSIDIKLNPPPRLEKPQENCFSC